jgi:hypothetical protein
MVTQRNTVLAYLRRVEEKLDRVIADTGEVKARLALLEGQINSERWQRPAPKVDRQEDHKPIDNTDLAKRMVFLFESASPSIRGKYETALKQHSEGELTNEQWTHLMLELIREATSMTSDIAP